MKRVLIVAIVLGLVAGGAHAQTKIAGFLGYGMSVFEDGFEDEDAAGYIPLGVQGLMELSPGLSVGAELNFAVVPFTWEFEVNGTKAFEWSISQFIIGGLVKYEIGQGAMKPHLRGGLGMYMGGAEVTYEEGYGTDYDYDYDNAFGFNIGAGVTADWGYDKFWLAEFVYHIVNRQAEDADEDFVANNWAIQLGAGMKL